MGTDVLLAVEAGPGVGAVEVLNDLDRADDGQLRLPNLVSGFPVLVVLRLTVPPAVAEQRICAVRLDWLAPGAERAHAAAGLVLPAIAGSAWESLAPDLEVQERAALLLVARLKKRATQALDRLEVQEARRLLRDAQALLRTIPPTPEVGNETQALAELDAQIEPRGLRRLGQACQVRSNTTSVTANRTGPRATRCDAGYIGAVGGAWDRSSKFTDPFSSLNTASARRSASARLCVTCSTVTSRASRRRARTATR